MAPRRRQATCVTAGSRSGVEIYTEVAGRTGNVLIERGSAVEGCQAKKTDQNETSDGEVPDILEMGSRGVSGGRLITSIRCTWIRWYRAVGIRIWRGQAQASQEGRF